MTKMDKHVPGTVCWVDLMASDAEKARAFYGAVFGWKFDVGGPEMGHYAMAQIDGRNVCGIGSMPPGAQFPSVWSTYFETTDVDASIAKAKELGGNVVMGPMDVMEAGRLAFLVDSTGAHFGLWQSKAHTGAQLVDEPNTMCWREVNTREAAKAIDFYCKLFGLEPKKLPGDMEYWTLHKGPTTVGGVMQMTKEWEGVPPHWMNYFAVDDTDAALKKIEAAGGKVSVPPFDTPYGRMSVVNDPNGAAFTVIKMTGKS